MKLVVAICLAVGGVSPARAQNPVPTSPTPPVVVPAQRTAAQNAAAAMGKQVSNEDIARAIRNSGLGPAEVRARLQQAGFDPKLADPFFGNSGAVTIVSDPTTLAAISSLGINLSGEEQVSTDPLVSDKLAAPTNEAAKSAVEKALPPSQRRFGRDVFISRSTSFDPEMSGPVDASYRLGIGDAIQVVLTGQVEQGYQVDVRRDGTILLQNLGAVPVAGLTLEAARGLVRSRAAKAYSGVADGKTIVDLTVTKLRSNQVRVIGEVERPGAYQVSGLSTVFNAIARAGGPSARGSFRNVEVRRGGEVIKHVDLYDYLIRGDASSDIRTEHGDMIFVPPAMRSVTVIGAMRREGIFELKDNEGFRDLITYAGGLLPTAATNRIHIDRTLPPEQRGPGLYRVVLDIPLDAKQTVLDTLKLQDDDVVTVYEIGDLRRNSVTVLGPVNQPGAYEWKPGLTLAQLVERAQGALPWALTDRVKIKRQLPSSGLSQLFSIDLADSTQAAFPLREFDEVTLLDGRDLATAEKVTIKGAVRNPGSRVWSRDLTLADLVDMANGFQPWAMTDRVLITHRELSTGKLVIDRIDARVPSALQLKLQPQDEIAVPDARVANPAYSVNIAGAVFQPGTKNFAAGMTVADLVDLAGGFRPEAQYLEIARPHRGADFSDTSAYIQRFAIDVQQGDNATWRKFVLERDDRVVVRSSPGFREIGSVAVTGAFRFPGSYVLQSPDERLSSIVRRAGGPLPIAYDKSLRVTRNGRPVPAAFAGLLKGGSGDDIIMSDGDQIQIDVQSNVVTVGGAVQRQVAVPYRKGWKLHDYIDAAGGFTDSANTSNIIVTYASGAVKRERSRFFNAYHESPTPEPGSTVTVGSLSPGQSSDWSKVFTITAQAAFTLSSLLLSYMALKK